MGMLPTLEQKTIKVENQQGELFNTCDHVEESVKVNILIEELTFELEMLTRSMNNCGSDAALMKQEVSRRVRGLQRFLSQVQGWE